MARTFDELREEYLQASLSLEELAENPTEQFDRWLGDAVREEIPLANGMALATVDEHGLPSLRIVLLKGFDTAGATFFTNYDSRKGSELSANAQASLLFWWTPLERQVRIEGRCERLSAADSDEYFHSRPRDSNLSAMASPQSAVVSGRTALEEAVVDLVTTNDGKELERPDNWGGYLLVPTRFEFWQGRENRLHDRFEYKRGGDGAWSIVRLAP